MQVDGKKQGDGLIAERDALIVERDGLKKEKSDLLGELVKTNRSNEQLRLDVSQLRSRVTHLEGEREAYGEILEKAMDKLAESGR